MLRVFSEGCDTMRSECDVTVHGWKLIYRLPHIGRLPESLFQPLYKVFKPQPKCECKKVDVHKFLDTSTFHDDIYIIFKVY